MALSIIRSLSTSCTSAQSYRLLHLLIARMPARCSHASSTTLTKHLCIPPKHTDGPTCLFHGCLRNEVSLALQHDKMDAQLILNTHFLLAHQVCPQRLGYTCWLSGGLGDAVCIALQHIVHLNGSMWLSEDFLHVRQFNQTQM